MKYIILIIVFVFHFFAEAESLKKFETLCVPVERFDLNPFRPINDGKEVTYLLLLTIPYLSKNGGISILSRYEFSPDGKVFIAEVNHKAKFNNGVSVSSLDAAVGIEQGLKHRPLGDRISVEKITVLNERRFKINLKSKVENIQGVFIEALMEGSRHNRIWPLRSNHKERSNFSNIASKYQVRIVNNEIMLSIQSDDVVKLLDRKNCHNPDYTMFPEYISADLDKYSFVRSINPHAISLLFHHRIPIKERKNLGAYIRHVFSTTTKIPGLETVNSFFLPGEVGFSNQLLWPKSSTVTTKIKSLIIACELEVFCDVLRPEFSKLGISVNWKSFPLKGDADLQILSSRITDGRHIILQDILKWNGINETIGGYKDLVSILSEISNRSASTLPPDDKLLHKFEAVSLKNFAFFPVSRKFGQAYSRLDSKFELGWTVLGDIQFVPRK